MTNPPVGPRFRLAPGVALRGGRRPPLPPVPEQVPDHPAGFRNTQWDRPSLAVTIDPVWLLAPLFVRDAVGLAPPGGGPGRVVPAIPAAAVTGGDLTAADWLAWWSGALAYRPGTPAPRQEGLVAGSAAGQRLWADLAGPFRDWLAARPARGPGADARARAAERAALSGFGARNGREPGRWTVRILQIPVTGRYLHSPEPRRIVVSQALRADPDAYPAALAAELPRHF